MRRLVVTGARGQLGSQVVARASEVQAFGSAELDITDAAAIEAVLQPGDVVLNCAAYTAVDAAESDPEAAFAVNETGARNVARACARTGARLIHISTDYVFDGRGIGAELGAGHGYDIDAPTAPLNVYGRSKLAGELAVRAELPEAQVVRTAWVYSGTGNDFVAVMARKQQAGENVRVVADRIGSPTYAGDLAVALLELANRPDAPLLLHAVGGGSASWFDLARAVFVESGADPDRVRPCRGADWPALAARPDRSVLSDRSWRQAGLTPLPPWRDGLRAALKAM